MSPKKFETNAIRTQTEQTQYGEHSTPLFLTSSFVFDDAEEEYTIGDDFMLGLDLQYLL